MSSPALVSELVGEAWSAILARWRTCVATGAGISLAIAALVATSVISQTVSSGIEGRFQAKTTTLLRAELASSLVRSGDLSERVERVRQINGVIHGGLTATATRLRSDLRSGPNPFKATSVRAAEPEALEALGIRAEAGRLFDTSRASGPAQMVLLGSAVPGAGDVPVRQGPVYVDSGSSRLQLAGVFDGGVDLPEIRSAAVVPFPSNIGDIDPDSVVVLVRVAPGATDHVAQQLAVALAPERPDGVIVRQPPDPRTLRETISKDTRTLVWVLCGLMLAVGVVGIANSQWAAVLLRRGEIGLMRAMGVSKSLVAGRIGLEACLVGTLGAVAGLQLGLVIGQVACGLSRLPPHVPWGVFATPLVGLVAGGVAGIVPAIRAVTLDPGSCLREL